MNSLAITTYNIDRYTTYSSFLAEYKEIGVTHLELNGRVPGHVIEAMLPDIESRAITIVSLHNVCPRPDNTNIDGLELSSTDEEARTRMVCLTKKTISTAAELGASAVVLHAGEVEGLRPMQKDLMRMHGEGAAKTAEYRDKRELLRTERSRRKKPFLESCEKSLTELAGYIEKKQLPMKLGLETPFYFSQIPGEEEYDLWFCAFADAHLHLWYDFGHWEVQTKLGLVRRNRLIESWGDRLAGLHIHDCIGLRDHQVPGEGDIDFTLIKPYLSADVARVLEFGRFIQPIERIKGGIKYVKKLGLEDGH